MIFVLADDLTGAAEIAGICLRYGLDVSFGIDTVPKKEATVTIIATDTRSLTADEAYKTHFNLAQNIISKTNNRIFKKCDSVLRGHVLTELSALMDVTEKSSVLLQPSNPKGNRCIKNGSYFINDELIENTGFATDPDFPSTTSIIKKLILDRTTKAHSLDVHTGQIKKIQSKGIFVPDCYSVEALSECIHLYNDNMIIGGSAAFFEQFLISLKLTNSRITNKKRQIFNNYMLISGSTHQESIRFAKTLEASNCILMLFPENLINQEFNETLLDDFVIKIKHVYNENKKVALRISNEIIPFEKSASHLKIRMSLIVKRLLAITNINELFIEGGATTYHILKTLNWKSFTPVEELDSGVVRMQCNLNPKKYITIKPGSYAWPNGLLN